MAQLATVAAFGFPDINPSSLLKVYHRLGCRTCQFYRNTLAPPDTTEARKIVEDHGVPFDSTHGVFGPQHDPSTPDESTRHAAIETYQAEGELALQLGVSMVVVHPAPIIPPTIRFTETGRATRIDSTRKSMEELAVIGEKQGVTYLFENLPGNYLFGSDPTQLAEMIRAVDHPRVRMCFDTGHANMATSDSAAAELLDDCLDVVAYLHVNDNDSRFDAHLIPGHGTIAWEEMRQRITKLPPLFPVMLELFQPEREIEKEMSNGLSVKLKRWLALNQ